MLLIFVCCCCQICCCWTSKPENPKIKIINKISENLLQRKVAVFFLSCCCRVVVVVSAVSAIVVAVVAVVTVVICLVSLPEIYRGRVILFRCVRLPEIYRWRAKLRCLCVDQQFAVLYFCLGWLPEIYRCPRYLRVPFIHLRWLPEIYRGPRNLRVLRGLGTCRHLTVMSKGFRKPVLTSPSTPWNLQVRQNEC